MKKGLPVTDPFPFYREQHLHDGPIYRAPADAVASWQELAEQVEEELTRMGFTASVVPNGDPQGLPSGARIWVHKIEPFGVALDWEAPVVATPEFAETVVAQELFTGLFAYVVNAKEIIIRALLDVLREAGFRVLIDHAGGRTYNYRVLEAPRVPRT
ncbi:hypothetical protein VSH64_00395 [Amycolatopsis rhabdoformis]|uniref:Uncharacterized protein n=1 Tax=Amycolatopsis rhabdoformis TaxID=1448059 RepID=A0ABZ1I8D0_9PSEU|nr:hypothetical protein [Amycolatopsis rhabdoformis]WSE30605.1 hypothetical protein VSH64_00395 [Amycolatopsis rhabdoformis]